MELALVFFWTALSIAAGFHAQNRGRSGVGWALFAVFLSPLLAFVFLAVLPKLEDDDVLTCPFCAEEILPDAKKCLCPLQRTRQLPIQPCRSTANGFTTPDCTISTAIKAQTSTRFTWQAGRSSGSPIKS